jgi:hypothetical protein
MIYAAAVGYGFCRGIALAATVQFPTVCLPLFSQVVVVV